MVGHEEEEYCAVCSSKFLDAGNEVVVASDGSWLSQYAGQESIGNSIVEQKHRYKEQELVQYNENPQFASSGASGTSQSEPLFLLPSNATVLRESAESSGKFTVVQVGSICPGQRIMALVRDSGATTFAKVKCVRHSDHFGEACRSLWCQLHIMNAGAEHQIANHVTIFADTPMLVQSDSGREWRRALTVRLGEDALCGVLLEGSSEASGSNEAIGALSNIQAKLATFNVDSKVATFNVEFVGIQLAEPENHSLLSGGGSVSQGDGRAFVALSTCLLKEFQSESEDDLTSHVHIDWSI